MTDSRREIGMRVRREVLGDAHVDRASARTTPFTAPFQDFITRVAWGDAWTRPASEWADARRDRGGALAHGGLRGGSCRQPRVRDCAARARRERRGRPVE